MAIVRKKNAKRLKKRPKRGRQELSLSLPDSKSKPSPSLQAYSMLIYGRKKIGKSSLVAEFPNTMFLMCEPGGKALEIFQKPVRNWREFEGYIDLVIKDDRFDTVCVDTSDYSYDFCMDYVCEKRVIDHPSDEDYGKGWKAVRREYTRVLNKLLHSGKGVVFISHSKDEEIKARKNESYHKVTSSMSGQAKDVLEGLIDIWVNFDYDGKKRFLIIQGNDEVDAGHRLRDHFNYPDGTGVERVYMGTNPRQAYENFISAFNNRAKGGNEEGKKRKSWC